MSDRRSGNGVSREAEMRAVASERRISLVGSYNFRDLGGLPVGDGRRTRFGRIYRSDSLDRLTGEDVDVLRPFGLATVIDLRSPSEVERSPVSPLLGDPSVRRRHVPFAPFLDASRLHEHEPDLEDLYRRMYADAHACVGDVFRLLADAATYPVVIHCVAGKDRTGLLVALLLRAVGVADAAIASDFALSGVNLAAYLGANPAAAGGSFASAPPPLLRADPAAILRAIETLDGRGGSFTRYLDDCGVGPELIEHARANLLE
jgi:protein-tyrosine phosphatase